MSPHTGMLWQYLGSFTLYTLLAIGMIYAAYWYVRKASGNGFGLLRKATDTKARLEIESMLSLEPRKNLYVVRAGQERFLIATGAENTHVLSKLDAEMAIAAQPVATMTEEAALVPEEPPVVAEVVVNAAQASSPWYTQPEGPVELPFTKTAPEFKPDTMSAGTMGNRLMQSVRWVLSARTRMT